MVITNPTGGRKVEFRSTNLPPSHMIEESCQRLSTFITGFDPMHLTSISDAPGEDDARHDYIDDNVGASSQRLIGEDDEETGGGVGGGLEENGSSRAEKRRVLIKRAWEDGIEKTQWLSGIKKIMDATSRVIALLQLGDPVRQTQHAVVVSA